MLRRLLANSRYVVILAVLGSLASAIALMAFGAAAVVVEIIDAFGHRDLGSDGGKLLAVELIELTDIFLLATVLYIVALGLYELFIDADLPVPAWLRVTSLDELKDKLVGVVVVLLAVTFLGRAVVWNGTDSIFPFGAAVALVIAALALPRWKNGKGFKADDVGGATRSSEVSDDR